MTQRSLPRRTASAEAEPVIARVGRPDQLNEAKVKVMLDAVRSGSPLHTATAAAGISDETLRRWRRKGEAAQAVPPGRRNPTERRFAEFCGVLDQALAECTVRMQQIVYATATQNEDRALAFRAATWYLTHRERDDYTTRHELVGKDDEQEEMTAHEAWTHLQAIASTLHAEKEEDGAR